MGDLMEGIREVMDAADEAASGSGGDSEDVLEGQEQEASQETAEEPVADELESAAEEGTEDPEESGEEEIEAGPADDYADRVDELPISKLPPKIAKMRSDRDRLASENGEMHRRVAELEAKLAAPEPRQEAATEEPMPPMPEESDDFQAVLTKMRAISKWEMDREIKGVDDKYQSKFQNIEEREQSEAVDRQQSFISNQALRIESRKDYTEDVGAMMSALAAENPGWKQGLATPGGWDQLCDYAAHLIAGQAKATAVTTKKATARQRAVPRGSVTPKQTNSDVEIPEDSQDIHGRVGAIMDSYRGD